MMFWVYGRDNCPYCKLAVELLESKGQSVTYIDIAGIKNTAQWGTVPQVFNESRHIGGYEDLQEYVRREKL